MSRSVSVGVYSHVCKLRIVHAEWLSLVIQEFMKGSVVYSKMNWRHDIIWDGEPKLYHICVGGELKVFTLALL